MPIATVEALIRNDGAQPNRTIVAAPAVGSFHPWVRPGDLVQPGDPIGELTRLNTKTIVVLARPSPILKVASRPGPPGWSPVDYATPLLVLEPVTALTGSTPIQSETTTSQHDDLPSNARHILASIEGLFYRSSSPDTPPFVTEGDIIKPGQVLGLVEVMKFFYEVSFELSGFESGARVERVVAEDGAAVTPDDVIAYVTPV